MIGGMNEKIYNHFKNHSLVDIGDHPTLTWKEVIKIFDPYSQPFGDIPYLHPEMKGGDLSRTEEKSTVS